jgi:hypothetical protein
MEQTKYMNKILVGTFGRKDLLEGFSIHGRKTLKLILDK